jgi:Mg2+ and Co2+ transporter CorA
MEIVKMENEINNLRNEVFDLENFMQDKNKNTLIKKLMSIKKNVIDIEISLDKLELKNYDISKQRKQLRKINGLLGHYDDYSDDLARAKHYRNTNLLTIISIISFPLTLIVGYFGMNFIGMGAHKKGIFGVKNPHIFIFILASVLLVPILFLYRIYHYSL